MNHPFTSKVPSFDIESITATIENAFAAAGLQTKTGPMRDVTETIRRALSSAGMTPGRSAGADASVIDVVAREISERPTEPSLPDSSPPVSDPAAPGQFVRRRFRIQAGTRAYKLYIPTSSTAEAMPLVVMLHGCTQSPDDFAAGTQMNRLAEEQAFIVVYPEQAANANGSKCWNWFKSQDQMRDSGEPSLIAGITREVVANHPIDPRRIYVAGLSAGAAMAVILGETYPDLYAGVGVHSGLPYGAAHDTPSAFAAMRGGRPGKSGLLNRPGLANPPGATDAPHRNATRFVPTIVFHGDQDQTVGHENAADIVQQATEALAREAVGRVLTPVTQTGVSPRGRGFSRTVYADTDGRPSVESWLLHGAGHAWAGGSASGSFTDSSGPDASAEMVRFFLAQSLAGFA